MKNKINILVAHILFVFLFSCGPGGGAGHGDDTPYRDTSGSYIFTYSYEFIGTSYSGYGDCITETEIENTISPFIIEQNGADLTLENDSYSCFGTIDRQDRVIFYCEEIEFIGNYYPEEDEILGTLSGVDEITNINSTSNCVSTGNANGDFSLIPF